MASSGSVNDDFERLMVKLAGVEPLEPRDEAQVRRIARTSFRLTKRQEQPIPEESQCPVKASDLAKVYKDGTLGLSKRGWMEFPRRLGAGKFGSVSLGMWIDLEKEKDKEPEPNQRQLCGIKVQEVKNRLTVWKEVTALRCLVHDNIIDYYDHFLVIARDGTERPAKVNPSRLKRLTRNPTAPPSPPSQAGKPGKPDPGPIPLRTVSAYPTLWIVMEFADAGTLFNELFRYPKNVIPESGVLFYAKQVFAAVRYMHKRHLSHGDLHLGNVVLKYLPDRTKKCLITDFGKSTFYPEKLGMRAKYFEDVFKFVDMTAFLLSTGATEWQMFTPDLRQYLKSIGRSDDALEMFKYAKNRRDCPHTAEELLSRPWFSHPAHPPVPPQRTELEEIKMKIPKAESMDEYLKRLPSPTLATAGTRQRRNSQEQYQQRTHSLPHLRHIALMPTAQQTVSHVLPEEGEEYQDLPHIAGSRSSKVPTIDEPFPRQLMLKPAVQYPEEPISSEEQGATGGAEAQEPRARTRSNAGRGRRDSSDDK